MMFHNMLQVAEDFIDISTPLKQLTEAALTPLGMYFSCSADLSNWEIEALLI